MSDSAERFKPLERITTGVPGLDAILHGGLERGGLYLINGEPGTGKTTLASQLCCHHVHSGGRAIFVTLLTESHSRLFAHLRTMSFFDMAVVGETLNFFSAYTELDQHGLDGLARFLSQMFRTEHPSLIVMDGFDTVTAAATSPLALRRFMHQIHAIAEALNCTLILLSQTVDDQQTPEQAMADGLIELHNQRTNARSIRDLEVRKLRGSDYLAGQHLLEITADGVVVHPRTEAVLLALPLAESAPRAQQSVGIARLDEMLGGGVWSASSTMVVGTPGSGKTLMGLHFLEAGARAGEPGLYFGLFERPARLLDKADRLGLSFSRWLDSGLLTLSSQWPRVDVLDVYSENLLRQVAAAGIKRVFVDGWGGLQHVAYPERLPAFFTALLDHLSNQGVTTFFSAEMRQLVGPELKMPNDDLAAAVDNIVFLRYVELQSQLYRLLSLIKVRDSQYDTAIREFAITTSGIEVASTFESAEAILTGIARPVDERSGRSARRRNPR